jgi:hypothetical protein
MLHKVIIVPGLGDNTKNIKWATDHYKKFGLDQIVHPIGWRYGEKHFKPKFQRLIKLIDKLYKDGNKVSLIGTSAGASAVVNVYSLRKNKINKVIAVCGRLRVGPEKGFRSFEKMTETSLAFKESVLMCQKNILKLTKGDKNKIMTITNYFDELVPPETSYIPGAKNLKIKSIEHMFSIWMSLSFFKPLREFLKH